ncbi:MAG: hypothetical protein KKC03_06450 [Bacteroidetes bacterium]|nr:hypothetical protein [Bacteroidota bacterium]
MEKITPDNGKTIAIISYITLIGLILAFVMNHDKKLPLASYHIRQSLGIVLSYLVLGFVNVIPLLGQMVFVVGAILLLIMWIKGLINAVNEKMEPVPLLGNYFANWFSTI